MTQEDYLAHHGILGQKWGVRRYQNADGSLTDDGRKRYGKNLQKQLNKADQHVVNNIEKSEVNRVRAEYYMKKDKREKAAEALAKKKEADEEIKKGEQLMWKLVADSVENGYNVRSLPKLRRTSETTALQLLTGPLGYGAVKLSRLGMGGEKEKNNIALSGYNYGAKYKVYDNGRGTRGQAILSTYR